VYQFTATKNLIVSLEVQQRLKWPKCFYNEYKLHTDYKTLNKAGDSLQMFSG